MWLRTYEVQYCDLTRWFVIATYWFFESSLNRKWWKQFCCFERWLFFSCTGTIGGVNSNHVRRSSIFWRDWIASFAHLCPLHFCRVKRSIKILCAVYFNILSSSDLRCWQTRSDSDATTTTNPPLNRSWWPLHLWGSNIAAQVRLSLDSGNEANGLNEANRSTRKQVSCWDVYSCSRMRRRPPMVDCQLVSFFISKKCIVFPVDRFIHALCVVESLRCFDLCGVSNPNLTSFFVLMKICSIQLIVGVHSAPVNLYLLY